MKGIRGFIGLIVVLAFASLALGAVPQLINFQGILTTAGGSPVANGSYSVMFRIYNAPTGGTVLWSENQTVTTSAGVFSVLLGSTSPIPDSAFNDSSRYLGITVAPDAEMAPRQKLTSVAFSNRVASLLGASGGMTVEIGDPGDTVFSLIEDGTPKVDMACPTPAPPAGPCPPWTMVTVGNPFAPFGQRAGVLRVLDCTGAQSIRANGWNGDFSARGKATFGPGHFNGGFYSFVAGAYNTVTGGTQQATIPGGYCNIASASYATVGGGTNNVAKAIHATVGGGQGNLANLQAATVGGGDINNALSNFSTVSGGHNNGAFGDFSAISGGELNRTNNTHASVGGGLNNGAVGAVSTVGGGISGTAFDTATTVGGGRNNLAFAPYSTVGGGDNDTANGAWSTVSGGQNNVASGSWSTIPGGFGNVASGEHSLAAGTNAHAKDSCSFVWSDCCIIPGSIISAPFYSNGTSSFNVRAGGGVYFITNCDSMLSPTSTGVILPPGGSAWSSLSDSTMKHNIRPVDGAEILAKLAELPVKRWSYKAQTDGIDHIGPMAQDFYKLFGVGEDNRHISTIDPDGIALAAIKELYARNLAQQSVNEAQQALIESLRSQLLEQASEFGDLKSQMASLQTTMETVLAAGTTQGDLKLSAVTEAVAVVGR